MESVKISFLDRLKLQAVDAILFLQNISLSFFQFLLFRKISNPQNILIFKVGNIGDVTCVIPSFIAIRRAYPEAKITLLTSPGGRGGIGAQNFISGAWYLDSIENYYSEDISTWDLKKKLLLNLRKKNFDLFIQIPYDWANWKTLFRNLFFAKFIGARASSGFRVRTFLSVFRKAQIDNLIRETEVEFQLRLLSESDIKTDKAEFDFPISEQVKAAVPKFIIDKLGIGPIVGICAGGKDEAKRWPAERFGEVANHLLGRGIKIIIFGGGSADKVSAEKIKEICGNSPLILDAVNILSIHEQIEALRQCKFLLTNDTGPMHLAAAVGIKVIALFSVRNILGTWFPYGEGNKVLYKRSLACDYDHSSCVRSSLELISTEEVISTCEELLSGNYINT